MRRGAFLTGAVAIAAVACTAAAGGRSAAPAGRIVFSSDRAPNVSPELFSIGRDGSGRRQLTPPLASFRDAALSPDGRTVVGATLRGLELRDVDGSHPRRLTTGAEDEQPVWSPDGANIAYVSGSHIDVVPARGGAPRQVDSTAFPMQPAWSPDGSELAYAVERPPNVEIRAARADGSSVRTVTTFPAPSAIPVYSLAWGPGSRIVYATRGAIYAVDASGGKPVLLTASPAADLLVSPDGTRIAYTSNGSAPGGPWVVNADGSAKTRLSAAGYVALAWSPDGRELAVVRGNPEDGQQLLRLEADGSGRVAAVTHEPVRTAITSASWTPDGSRLLYVASQRADRELYSMRPNGTGLRELTRNLVDDADPAPSPDGRTIAFERDGTAPGLYLARPGGSGVRRLTHALDSQPAWSPDGKRLAFVRTVPGRSSSLDVLDLRTRRVRRLVARVDQQAAPSWSRDGWIAYVVDRDGPQIRAIRPGGGRAHAVVGSGGGNGGAFPAWAPGGGRLAYVRRVQIQVGFYAWSLVVRDASGRSRTLAQHVAASRPAWSPDGRRLVYSTGGSLFSIAAGGGAPRRLQRAPGSSDQPAWGRR